MSKPWTVSRGGYTNWVAALVLCSGCGRSVDRLAAAAILPKNTLLLKVCAQYTNAAGLLPSHVSCLKNLAEEGSA